MVEMRLLFLLLSFSTGIAIECEFNPAPGAEKTYIDKTTEWCMVTKIDPNSWYYDYGNDHDCPRDKNHYNEESCFNPQDNVLCCKGDICNHKVFTVNCNVYKRDHGPKYCPYMKEPQKIGKRPKKNQMCKNGTENCFYMRFVKYGEEHEQMGCLENTNEKVICKGRENNCDVFDVQKYSYNALYGILCCKDVNQIDMDEFWGSRPQLKHPTTTTEQPEMWEHDYEEFESQANDVFGLLAIILVLMRFTQG